MKKQEIIISPVIKKLAEEDSRFRQSVLTSICQFVTRVSFGSTSAVQQQINEELIRLNETGHWKEPRRISSPGDLIAAFYAETVFRGKPSIWIMEETREISLHPRIIVMTGAEYLRWYMPPHLLKKHEAKSLSA